MAMILAGDTGGTKTLLALYEPGPDGLHVLHEDTFACAEFDSLNSIVDQFLRRVLRPSEVAKISAACFGVAGPVTGDTAKITNLPWLIDAKQLSPLIGGVPVTLLNDLQATALGMLALPSAAFAILQKPEATVAGNATIAVIAPGTGLGQSLLVSSAGRYRALPSEGGHADFAATTEEEIDLLRFLRGRHGHHISYERVICGDGIGDLYAFARSTSGEPEPAWLTAKLQGPGRNATISAEAIAGSDACCARAIEMFVAILGSEAGNMALRGLATGGVLLGGGIPPKILPALQSGSFIDRFRDKGRFGQWMSGLSVRVALEPRAALLGAAHCAVAS
jgi:glucokinase